MYSAIIIDDEEKARSLLKRLLEENCPQIEIVAQAEDVPSAVKLINQHQPHIVFSDIDMPKYNGFQLLEFVDKTNFELIYCTGHDEYALKAFEVSAIGYLLKPIQISSLIEVVDKAIKMIDSNSIHSQERFELLKENLHKSTFSKIALPVLDGFTFINVNDIVALEAEGSYTNLYLSDKNKLVISKKIKYFEQILENHKTFFRVHRSHIINTSYILQYIKTDGGSIVLQHNRTVPIARERKEEFLNLINNI